MADVNAALRKARARLEARQRDHESTAKAETVALERARTAKQALKKAKKAAKEARKELRVARRAAAAARKAFGKARARAKKAEAAAAKEQGKSKPKVRQAPAASGADDMARPTTKTSRSTNAARRKVPTRKKPAAAQAARPMARPMARPKRIAAPALVAESLIEPDTFVLPQSDRGE